MAALEAEREQVRKRKERRDSGCTHERKERRPTSEDRAPPPPPPPPLHDSNRLETERRTERLCRARRPPQTKRRRPIAKLQRIHQENNFISEDKRTPSPPRLDLAVLHRQLGREEPELSWGAEEYRPDNYRPDDYTPEVYRPEVYRPSLQARVERPQLSECLVVAVNPEHRLQKIKKKVHMLKKSILSYESDFETVHSRSMSQSDRMTDVQLTRMYEALQKLQIEKRCIKADPAEYALKVLAAKKQKQQDDKFEEALQSDKLMADLVLDVEEWLCACREVGGRTGPSNTWSLPQLCAEKLCVQKALLRLEAARGRPPTHSAERGAARHLYDQYRRVKRELASRSDAVLGTLTELSTILEHEPMLFPTVSVDSSSDSQEKMSDNTSENTSNQTASPTTQLKQNEEQLLSPNSSAKSSDEQYSAELPNFPSNESLHCLSLDELMKLLCETKLQKSQLRRTIKEYENSFESKNSRKLQKDEKKTKEDDYLKYKALKARLRLINALVNKQKIISMK